MINYNKIVTKEQFEQMEQEKYKYAVKEGTYHGRYFRAQYGPITVTKSIAKRAEEITKCGMKYLKENETVKSVIATNMVFPDNKKFIQALLSRKITYNTLYSYSRLISKLHHLAMTASELEIDEITIANKKINSLCSIIKLYFGITNYNMIITKINEIITHHRELYKEMEKELLDSPKVR